VIRLTSAGRHIAEQLATEFVEEDQRIVQVLSRRQRGALGDLLRHLSLELDG
jgi:hypothetical protein